MKVLLGVAAVHVIAIGMLSMTGCKSQEVLKDRPYIPAPSESPAIDLSTTNIILPPTPVIPEIKTEPIKYKVVSGDSFWKISRSYGVSKEELAAYNNMSLQKPLKIGTTLMIPPGGAPVPPEKLAAYKSGKEGAKGAPRPSDGSYTVVNGDSLWKIANKYNVKTDALISANNLDPKKALQVGQKLTIPEAGAAAPAGAPLKKPLESVTMPIEPAKPAGPSEEEKLLNELEGGAPSPSAAPAMDMPAAPAGIFSDHPVSEGETVDDVAQMYGLRTDDIRNANPGIPADGKLKAGSTIKIPEK
ncbi:MAG TPA: hypothetical protein DCZ94_18365 [Lentisphaeria bacterium]|nr:MAG: hypothetical protein A2X48_23920 [Lentisphaerae bacterium GWF2_49_21]HBC88911.1 hypothetical protein [Lentisphaeria bacterium]